MKKFSFIALIFLAILIVIFATDVLFLWIPWIGHTPEYASKASAFFMALTAFMTLLLAFATFHSTEQINSREQERRKDAIEREYHQKQERCLTDIINWAIDVIDFTAGQTTFSAKDLIEIMKSGISFKTITKTSAHDRHVKLNKLSSKAVYIVSLGELVFPKSTDLNLTIHNVRRKIYEHLCFLTLEMNGKIKNTGNSTQLHLTRLLNESVSLVNVTTDLSTKIK